MLKADGAWFSGDLYLKLAKYREFILSEREPSAGK